MRGRLRRAGRARSPPRPRGEPSRRTTASSPRARRGEAARGAAPPARGPWPGRAPAGGPPTPEGDAGERDDRHRGPESELGRRGAEGGAARRRGVPGREELGPDVAADRVRQADEDEEARRRRPSRNGARRGRRGAPRPARPRQRRERERKRDADDADEHQAELEDVGPRRRRAAPEARVGDEERGGGDEDRGAVPVGQRGDDGLGRLREEGEPDDLGEDDEERGDLPHPLPVEASDDGGERHLSRLADLAGQEEAEGRGARAPRRGRARSRGGRGRPRGRPGRASSSRRSSWR